MNNENVGLMHFWMYMTDGDKAQWRELQTILRERAREAGSKPSKPTVIGLYQICFWAGFDALHQNFDDAFPPALSHMLGTAREVIGLGPYPLSPDHPGVRETRIDIRGSEQAQWRELENLMRERARREIGGSPSGNNLFQIVYWAGFDALHQNFDDAFPPALSHMLDTARVLAARRAKMEGGN